ncbi:MAG: 3'-5' exonuclease [Gammaproteobacteria bacterium]
MLLNGEELENDAVMIDLETMGNGPLSAIVAIGAVSFSFKRREIIDKFYIVIDLQSAVDNGGKIDAATVMWWLKQSDQARQAIRSEQFHINEALIKFLEWFNRQNGSDSDKTRIWGNGSDFDNVILASAYKSAGLILPWRFFNNRCYRTVKNFFPSIKIDSFRVGDYHNALNDAESQAHHLMAILSY